MAGLERRVRKLEEATRRVGYGPALQMLPDEDFAVLWPYLQRWEAAGGERVPQPQPTPEEAIALAKLNQLRQQSIALGWGDSAFRSR